MTLSFGSRCADLMFDVAWWESDFCYRSKITLNVKSRMRRCKIAYDHQFSWEAAESFGFCTMKEFSHSVLCSIKYIHGSPGPHYSFLPDHVQPHNEELKARSLPLPSLMSSKKRENIWARTRGQDSPSLSLRDFVRIDVLSTGCLTDWAWRWNFAGLLV